MWRTYIPEVPESDACLLIGGNEQPGLRGVELDRVKGVGVTRHHQGVSRAGQPAHRGGSGQQGGGIVDKWGWGRGIYSSGKTKNTTTMI